MKIVFARTEDNSLQLVSLCHPEEVALNLDFWREKYGAAAEFYALNCPGWELTQADVADGGEAATHKATGLIIHTLQRVSAGEHVAELESLDRPAPPLDSAPHHIDAPPLEPDIRPATYVIWRAEANSFWAGEGHLGLTAAENAQADEWTTNPANARSFAERSEAEAAAQSLVVSHRYELSLCALHETASHYWKEPLRDFFPLDSLPSLN